MNETTMRPEEELALIRHLIDDGQRYISDNGKHFIAWGALTVVGLTITYAAVAGMLTLGAIWPTWIGVMLAGWGFSWWSERRYHHRAPARTLATRMLTEVWIGVGIGIVLLVFGGGMFGAIPPPVIPAVVAALAGIGYFTTGFLYSETPVRLLAWGWWLGALAMLAWPGDHSLLVLAVLVVLLEILPGVWLYMRTRSRMEERLS